MKKCKSSNTRILHLYEPVANNSILRAEMTNPRERTEMSIEKFRSHVVFLQLEYVIDFHTSSLYRHQDFLILKGALMETGGGLFRKTA